MYEWLNLAMCLRPFGWLLQKFLLLFEGPRTDNLCAASSVLSYDRIENRVKSWTTSQIITEWWQWHPWELPSLRRTSNQRTQWRTPSRWSHDWRSSASSHERRGVSRTHQGDSTRFPGIWQEHHRLSSSLIRYKTNSQLMMVLFYSVESSSSRCLNEKKFCKSYMHRIKASRERFNGLAHVFIGHVCPTIWNSLSNVAIVAKKTYARDVNGQPARCRLYLLNKLRLTYFL